MSGNHVSAGAGGLRGAGGFEGAFVVLLQAMTNVDDHGKGADEFDAEWSESIPDRGRRGWFGGAENHTQPFQPFQARCEHLGGNAGEIGLEFVEPALAIAKIPDDVGRPGSGEQFHAFAQGAIGRRRRDAVLPALDHVNAYQMVTRFSLWSAASRDRVPAIPIHRGMTHTHQTVVITGASSGIGLALAKTFSNEGFNVVANSRRLTASGALEASQSLVLVDGDIGDPATAKKLIATARLSFGTVDVLINNAGIFVPKPFHKYSFEDFQSVFRTNVEGFFHVTQEAVRQMREQGGGQIITITTALDQQPQAGVPTALTNLTKGGLNSVTRELAIEYAKEGIRVNAIAPGIIDTPMHKPENHEYLAGLHPIARIGTVDEIAQAALFLVRAPFVTGEVLHVDGGAHAGRW